MMRTVAAFDANQYQGMWVAFKPHTDEVVATGSTLNAAIEEATDRGIEDAQFYRVPSSDAYFVGAG